MNISKLEEQLTEEQLNTLKEIPDLTLEQQAFFYPLIERIIVCSVNKGIKAAVEMIRLTPSAMSLAELSNRIEAVIED